MNKPHKYFIKKQLNPQPPNITAPTTPKVEPCSSNSSACHCDQNVFGHNLCTELHIRATSVQASIGPSPTHPQHRSRLALAPVVAMLSQRLDASLPKSTLPQQQQLLTADNTRGQDEKQEQEKKQESRSRAAALCDPFIIIKESFPCELTGNLLLLLLLVCFAGYCSPWNFYHNQIVAKDTKTLHTKLVNSYVLGKAFAFFYVNPNRDIIIENNL